MEDDSKIFPQRLMEILSDERNADYICWLPHGRAFVVRDRDRFAEHVMPRYFSRHAKYSSFTRKLNRWNFSRVSSGPEIGAYYHEFFLRDKPQLAAQMFCKNARSKLAMSTDTPTPASEKPAPTNVAPKPNPNATEESIINTTSASTPPPAPQLDVPTLPPDIPLALLEFLSKGPINASENRMQTTQGATPGRLLQQSQYANLLLERQIQVLQREQAKLLLVREAMALKHQREQAELARMQQRQASDEQRLRRLMEIKAAGQEDKTNRGPTNHRASAA